MLDVALDGRWVDGVARRRRYARKKAREQGQQRETPAIFLKCGRKRHLLSRSMRHPWQKGNEFPQARGPRASSPEREQAVRRLADEYEGRGFQVTVEPPPGMRPPFLGDYAPDLIAVGPNECVVVEVKVGTEVAHGSRLRALAERVAKDPGWRFSLVLVHEREPERVSSDKPLLADPQVAERISQAKQLVDLNMLPAAFLLLWGAIEGALRKLAERANLPLDQAPSSTLLRELFSTGELSRPQFNSAMDFLSLRNTVAHGFGSDIKQEDVQRLLQLSDDLLHELGTGGDAP